MWIFSSLVFVPHVSCNNDHNKYFPYPYHHHYCQHYHHNRSVHEHDHYPHHRYRPNRHHHHCQHDRHHCCHAHHLHGEPLVEDVNIWQEAWSRAPPRVRAGAKGRQVQQYNCHHANGSNQVFFSFPFKSLEHCPSHGPRQGQGPVSATR